MWSTGEEIAECANPHLYQLWRRLGSRPECSVEHSGKSTSMYPGAQGNIRFAGKRFWTDCLYSYTQTGYEQAGWMKEDPPAFDAGECQLIASTGTRPARAAATS